MVDAATTNLSTRVYAIKILPDKVQVLSKCSHLLSPKAEIFLKNTRVLLMIIDEEIKWETRIRIYIVNLAVDYLST